MKILHIDETFHPNYGYQCNPLSKFQKKAGNDVWIIAPDGKFNYHFYTAVFGENMDELAENDKRYEDAYGVKIVRVHGKRRIMGRLLYNVEELCKRIDEINPDVILVHCVETLTAMIVMKKYKNRYPMVFDSHMLSMATKNKFAKIYEVGYRLLITSLIKKKKYTVIKTQDDDYVTTHLGIPKEQTIFISFGTDTLFFCPDEKVKEDFLKENNLPADTFVISSTGKLNENKGGMLFAEAVAKKFDTERPVAVVVLGSFKGEYQEKVKEMLDKSENRVIYYPFQKYLNLPKFYQIADVTVFPKQCSMSFYDAQSCGSPVVSEDNNINIDRNSHGNGLCFKAGDAQDFKAKLEEIMNMPEEEYKKMRKNSCDFVTRDYSYEKIAKQYTDILEAEYKRFYNK